MMSEENAQSKDGDIESLHHTNTLASNAPTDPLAVGGLLSYGKEVVMSRMDLLFCAVAVQFTAEMISYGLGILFSYGTSSAYFYFMAAVMVLSTILLMVVSVVNSIVVVYAIVADRERVTYGEGLVWVKDHLFGYFWLALLSFCIIIGGFLLFFIPGIIASVFITFSIVVYIRESQKGMDAIMRSRQLILGVWGKVFKVMILVVLIGFLAGLVIGLVGGIIGGALSVFLGNAASEPVVLLATITAQFVMQIFAMAVVARMYIARTTTVGTYVSSEHAKKRTLYSLLGWGGFIGIIVSVFYMSFILAMMFLPMIPFD